MKVKGSVPKTVDEYILSQPHEMQILLNKIRSTLLKAAPGATEKISYMMPSLDFHGALVYYAACKNHLGFYPMPSAIIAFKKELASYETTKGAVQIPYDQKMPLRLLEQIVKFRVIENKEKFQLKSKKATAPEKKS